MTNQRFIHWHNTKGLNRNLNYKDISFLPPNLQWFPPILKYSDAEQSSKSSPNSRLPPPRLYKSLHTLTLTLSFFFLQQFVLLLKDEQIVLLHCIKLLIIDVLHQFYLRIRPFSDLLDLEILVQQFPLNMCWEYIFCKLAIDCFGLLNVLDHFEL